MQTPEGCIPQYCFVFPFDTKGFPETRENENQRFNTMIPISQDYLHHDSAPFILIASNEIIFFLIGITGGIKSGLFF